MKRSELIKLLNSITIEGVDDPDVRYRHPERFPDVDIVHVTPHKDHITLEDYCEDKCEICCPPEQPKKVQHKTRAQREAEYVDTKGVNPIEFEAFVSKLIKKVEHYINQPLTHITTASINACIAQEFNQRKLEKGLPLIMAEGMAIVGGKAIMYDFDVSSVTIAWTTDFYPRARFSGQEGEVVALGFFEEYDLYVGLQAGLGTTLIARYGNDHGSYLTFNPSYAKIESASECFVEAYNRAIFTNSKVFDQL